MQSHMNNSQGNGGVPFGMFFMKILILMLLGSQSYSLETDTIPRRISGKVISQTDSTAIPNVHVINISRATGTTTAVDGTFSLWISPGNRIMYQALGFTTDTLWITEDFFANPQLLTVELSEKIYDLPAFEVFPYATFAEFKYAFLNFEDPEPEIDLNLPPSKALPPGIHDDAAGGGVTITGPITYLYDRFSRRGRELARYHEVVQEDQMARRAERVVNHRIIAQLTGLEDYREINEFLRFCNLDDAYIVNTKEYVVYQKILFCYRQYAALEK